MPKTIKILLCHTDDFNAHPGWWAVMHDPGLKVGETVDFEFADNSLRGFRASVLNVIRPGEPRPEAFRYSNFSEWFIIMYQEMKEPDYVYEWTGEYRKPRNDEWVLAMDPILDPKEPDKRNAWPWPRPFFTGGFGEGMNEVFILKKVPKR